MRLFWPSKPQYPYVWFSRVFRGSPMIWGCAKRVDDFFSWLNALQTTLRSGTPLEKFNIFDTEIMLSGGLAASMVKHSRESQFSQANHGCHTLALVSACSQPANQRAIH